MDYSRFQVKYIDNIIPESRSLELPEETFSIPDTSSLSYLNGEAQPATVLIQEEEPKQKKKTPARRTMQFRPSVGLSNFNSYYDKAIQMGGNESEQLRSRRQLFTALANHESSFNPSIQNRAGVPAYGYFQFMQGNYRGQFHNNIGQYAGTDLNTFRNSPILQIQAANRLANSFLSSFNKVELEKLHQMGYSDSAIIAGCWLGGAGGVKNFAFRNKNSRDVHGTSVGKYMQMFNNL